VVASELIRISHELTPGSRFVEVAGAGHSAYFEQPEAWNEAVLGFIDEVEAGRAARSDDEAAG
jgi:pimeloyl-ACP methyl ester carboxylesterase